MLLLPNIALLHLLVVFATFHCALAFSSPRRTRTMSVDPYRLGYVTDLEGHIDFFLSFVERSNVLDVVSNTPKKLELDLRDGCYFVFGGDSVDKAPGDIRLCRSLVSLKRRYPDRVFLLVGNRDLNKIRFTAELSAADMERDIDEIPSPHWDPNAPSLRTYLEQVAKAKGMARAEDANTRVERLRYMLKHTLGCPDTFEFRRQELAILKECGVANISDDQVCDSFIFEVENEEGSLRQYLENANVAAVVGNTLFVHGAVDLNTMRFVPRHDTKFELPTKRAPPGKVCEDLIEWVDSLNDYLRVGMKDYQARPVWDEGRTTRGGEALLALQNRCAVWGRSVISNCYGDGGVVTNDHAVQYLQDPNRAEMEDKDPMVFENVSSDPKDPVVAAWLKKNGIRRVVVGHKPTGDCPAVLSSAFTGVEIASGDTSFSDVLASDNRGLALPVIEIVGENAVDNHLEISGRFNDGRDYHSTFHRLYGKDDIDVTVGDPTLGTEANGGYWVKASCTEKYRLCRGKGRKVEHDDVPIAEFRARFGK